MMGRAREARRVIGVVAAGDGGADAVAAASVAMRLGASLALVAPAAAGAAPGGVEDARLRSALRDATRQMPDVHVAHGRLAVDAVHVTEEHAADLLVLGRHLSEGEPLLLDDLLFRARVPVLSEGRRPGGAGPVVAALDGEERGVAVMLAGAELARRLRASLVAVAVDDHGAAEPAPRSARAERVARLIERVTAARPVGLAGRIRIWPREGEVGAAIAAAAREAAAAVIVVGRRTGSRGGAHARAVLAAWDGPVLLVPI